MSWTPISNTPPQYEENGIAASGYYIKFYESGTTTPTAMATDSTGTTLLDKCELNPEGYPINGSSAVFIPHINAEYKIALFRNATDANANDLNNAVWDVDDLSPVLATSEVQFSFPSLTDAIASASLIIGGSVRTDSYRSQSECTTLGIPYPDGGSADYVVVAGGTGTADGGSFINAGSLQLKLIHSKVLNALQFGCIANGAGAGTDTQYMDALFSYYDLLSYQDGDAINGSREIMLIASSPALYFPSGQYNYNGTGYTPSANKVFVIKGDGPANSMINIQSDVHLCLVQDSSPVMAYVETNSIKFNGGRGAFFNDKTNIGNVAQGKRVFNTAFIGYTSVAFGSSQLSDARWVVQSSWFDAGNAGTPVGLLLPHEVAEIDVSGNSFAGNKYSIITANDGISELNIGPNNSFFTISGRPKEADIWIQAGDSKQGLGVAIINNRFSNENLDATKPNFLIADRDNTTSSHVFTHSAVVSTNSVSELSIRENTIAGTGNPLSAGNVGYIVSYVSGVKGLRWRDNRVSQWRPTIIDFAAGITPLMLDEAGAGMSNIIEVNNQTVSDLYNVRNVSNISGASFIKTDDNSLLGYTEQLSPFNNNVGDIINLTFTSNVRNSQKGTSVTKTDILDSQGGATAAEFTYGADESVVLITDAAADGVAGKTGWIEFEVKRAAANSLEAIQFELVIHGKTSFYTLSLNDTWQNVRIPFLYSENIATAADFTLILTPKLFLDVGVSDSFAVGRKVVYQSNGPTPYVNVAI